MMISVTRATPRWPRIFLVLAVLITVIFFFYGSPLHTDRDYLPSLPHVKLPGRLGDWVSGNSHPIDSLIEDAKVRAAELEAKQTKGVKEAAAAYRRRRGRHPPPNFDKWVEYAESKNAVMVEDFFDQIYKDIAPFWALDSKTIREAAASWEYVISVRDGIPSVRSDNGVQWLRLWSEMMADVLHMLPDLDIALNEMDEPRLLVPWEKINEYMKKSNSILEESGTYANSDFQISFTTNLEAPASLDKRPPAPAGHEFVHDDYWPHFRETCHPDSDAHGLDMLKDYSVTPIFPTYPKDHRGGYIQNVTTSRDACVNPHFRALHGSFIQPISMSTDHALFPMFGGSKLPQNNEILLPAPIYWTDDAFYSGGEEFVNWDDKKDALIWRGTASGGRNRPNTWARFQRHRFNAMCNGSWVDSSFAATITGEVPSFPIAFPFPNRNVYNLVSRDKKKMSDWLDAVTDVKFTHLGCDPPQPDNSPFCPYTGNYFDIAPPVSMHDQYFYKYLPDIDGNSFSGRYRAFLRSHSLPIKATVYKEWHDDRLVAWRHYVPMDITMVDFWGILEYFLGYSPVPITDKGVRDEKAEEIAMAGSEWAGKVLRKEDMTIYMARALLEYARVSDDARERLGYVADLM